MNLVDEPVRLETPAGWLDLDGYRSEYARQAQRLAGLGLEADGIAAFFEVDRETLEAWRATHPDLTHALERGWVGADLDVSAALYRAAVGHERVERRTVGGRTVACTVHVPADVRACMFWLERRCPEQWGRRQDAVRADAGTVSEALAVA